MISNGMLLRIRRSDGLVLLEQSIDPPMTDEQLAARATAQVDVCEAAVADGYGWVLETSDPDGVLAPRGVWLPLDSSDAPDICRVCELPSMFHSPEDMTRCALQGLTEDESTRDVLNRAWLEILLPTRSYEDVDGPTRRRLLG